MTNIFLIYGGHGELLFVRGGRGGTRRAPKANRVFFAQLRHPSTISPNLYPEVVVQTDVNEA